MRRQLLAALAVVSLAIGAFTLPAVAAATSVTVVDVGVGEVTLTFTNPNSYVVCFEYRSDGDTNQASGDPNFNINYSELYPYLCLTGASDTRTLFADSYVEVPSVFGAERDVDFDWIAFEVLPEPSDGGGDIGLGSTSNIIELDQGSAQDQNQHEDQDQVVTQQSSHSINQHNTSGGDAGAEVSSTCEASLNNSDGGEDTPGCESSDTEAGDSDEGDSSQTSSAEQVSTINNSQIQSQTGGSQTNSPDNVTEQVSTSHAGNLGGDVNNSSVITTDDNSDDDGVDNQGGVIDNSTDDDGVDGDNNVVNDEELADGLLDELEEVMDDLFDSEDHLVIDNG